MSSASPPPKGDHVEQTVEELTHLYDEHHRGTSRAQRVANRLTAALGRPDALIGIIGAMLGWTAGNIAARRLGWVALERFPFPDLAFVATVGALLVALLILTTQRHEYELGETRARLTLQIAALSEKKIAELIEQHAEPRSANPLLPERLDNVAADMAKPVDAGSELASR